jgi:hypothetical protein
MVGHIIVHIQDHFRIIDIGIMQNQGITADMDINRLSLIRLGCIHVVMVIQVWETDQAALVDMAV